MSPPTAILAEDEKALRDELRQRLGELWPELVVIGEAGTGIEALQLLGKHAPDLMFLDIQMPGMTGLEVAHQAQGRCHIVFVTAYDAYAVAAFESGALDYVLKPLERERLRLAVDRVRQRLGLHRRISKGCSANWSRMPSRASICGGSMRPSET